MVHGRLAGEAQAVLTSRGYPAEFRVVTPAVLTAVQEYLAHDKTQPPHKTTIGRQASPYCRVLGEGFFLWGRYPCRPLHPEAWFLVGFRCAGRAVQEYLAHKKQPLP
jgi:hypothetical protein